MVDSFSWKEEGDRLRGILTVKYLKKCAANGKIEEWNEKYLAYLTAERNRIMPNSIGREFNPSVFYNSCWINYFRPINLEGVNLQRANLRRVNLQGANLGKANLWGVNLQEANLENTKLQGVNLIDAKLQGAMLLSAELQNSTLRMANLQRANLEYANLQESNLSFANLQETNLFLAKLQRAELHLVNIQGANFSQSIVSGDTIIISSLEKFWTIQFEKYQMSNNYNKYGETRHILKNMGYSIINRLITFNKICASFKMDTQFNTIKNIVKEWRAHERNNRCTNFTGVGLDSCRIEPELKTKLKANIRECQWRKWFKKHRILMFFLKPFWFISDYGRSTFRIIVAFFIWNLIFGNIYYLFKNYFPFISPDLSLPECLGQAMILSFNTIGILSLPTKTDAILHGIGILFVLLHIIGTYVILAALVSRFSTMLQDTSP